MAGSKKITVVLADDNEKIRRIIHNLLNRTPDIEVAGEAGDGQAVLDLVEVTCPDVLLLDMEMPVLDGNQVAGRLKATGSPVRILVVSAYDDQQYVLGMLNSGVSGYLTKEDVPDGLIDAVRGVAHGEEGWISPRLAKKFATRRKMREPGEENFTSGEIQIYLEKS